MRSSWVCECGVKTVNGPATCRECSLQRGHTRGPSGATMSPEYETGIRESLKQVQSVTTLWHLLEYWSRRLIAGQLDSPEMRLVHEELMRRGEWPC